MKYTFTKIDDDTTELSYKGKSFMIKKDVDLLKRMESLPQRAKIKMASDLKLEGMTLDDLQVEKKVGNKTYIDKSSIVDLEKYYQDVVANEILNEICQKYTKMNLMDLFKDIEINISDLGAEEQLEFTTKLLTALKGDTSPSVQIEEI